MILTLGVKDLVEQGEIRSPQPLVSLVPCGNVHYLHQLLFSWNKSSWRLNINKDFRKILEEYVEKFLERSFKNMFKSF
jgi:hypothetical protein